MSGRRYEILRFGLLLLGGFIGTALAVGYAWLNWERFEAAPHDSFQRMAISFQSTIIFIAAVYDTGRIGMMAFGLDDQARETRIRGRNHLLLLNAMLLAIFLLSFVFE